MEKLLLQKISLLLCLVTFTFGASAGGYGGATRRAPMSAAAWSRGGASTANPELGYAFWNPARASSLSGLQLSFGGAILPLGRGDGYAAAEGRVGRSRVGLSGIFLYRGVSDLGEQYQSDGIQIESGESYATITTKMGLSFAISKRFSLGLSMGWYYSSLPIDYANGKMQYAKSSNLGGVTLMGSWEFSNGIILAAGVRDLFLSDVWDQENTDGGYTTTLTDTSLALWTAGFSQNWDIATQNIRYDTDINIAVMNSYFGDIGASFATWNNGVTWSLNEVFAFRIGIRDILLTSTLFSDSDRYKNEAIPKFSGGVGMNLGDRIQIAGLTINYALSGSGVGAGIDHLFDFQFEF